MAFVHDDVLEVGEQFGMILHTADGGECYPAYLFWVEGSRIDAAIKNTVWAEFLEILFEYFLRGLEHQGMTVKPCSYIRYDKRLSAARR